MIKEHMYVLAVPNLSRSAEFYRDVLGFEVRVSEFGGWQGAMYLARLPYIQHIPPRAWPHEPFASDEWKRSAVGTRHRFAKSLLADRSQIGQTIGEVAKSLGGDIPSGSTQWFYPLEVIVRSSPAVPDFLVEIDALAVVPKADSERHEPLTTRDRAF
jgi:catechol 2,3-dioxygenase-like lactoylglutathione lyase family enzyme